VIDSSAVATSHHVRLDYQLLQLFIAVNELRSSESSLTVTGCSRLSSAHTALTALAAWRRVSWVDGLCQRPEWDADTCDMLVRLSHFAQKRHLHYLTPWQLGFEAKNAPLSQAHSDDP
jgi:hypothetical protein